MMESDFAHLLEFPIQRVHQSLFNELRVLRRETFQYPHICWMLSRKDRSSSNPIGPVGCLAVRKAWRLDSLLASAIHSSRCSLGSILNPTPERFKIFSTIKKFEIDLDPLQIQGTPMNLH